MLSVLLAITTFLVKMWIEDVKGELRDLRESKQVMSIQVEGMKKESQARLDEIMRVVDKIDQRLGRLDDRIIDAIAKNRL